MQDDGLQERHEHRDRQEEEADADEEKRPAGVHPCSGGEDLSPRPPAREAEWSGRAPACPHEQDGHEQERARSGASKLERMVDEPNQRDRAPPDGAAEEARRTGSERPTAGTV